MRNRILVVIGRSGAGKTSLSSALASEIGCEKLGFSYAGRELAKTRQGKNDFLQLEEYIYNCILNALRYSRLLVLDGLASENIYNHLISKGNLVSIIHLDVPEKTRIKRIAKREGCSYEEAMVIEKIKEKGKNNSGIEYIISKADITINGLKKPNTILKQVLQYYKSLEYDDSIPNATDSEKS